MYLGGTGADTALALALDGSGNIALAGASASSDFPTLSALDSSSGGGSCSGSPCNDAIVAELNASGSALRYSTYLGAAGDDQARGVAVDASGKLYATGVITGGLSTLNGYSTAPIGGMDAFLVKLDPQQSGSASLLYGSYLGGSSDDEGYGLALDSAGLAYIAGRTASSTFPTRNAAQSSRGGGSDAFLSVLDPASSGSASLRYSTYLGGSSYDRAAAVAMASPSSVALTGLTNSSNFPLAQAYQASNAGSYDAFVTKLNPSTSGSGSLLYGTYLGASGDDRGLGIAISGNLVTLAGSTTSSTFPTASATQAAFGGGTCGSAPCTDAFVSQLNLGTSTLSFSTFLGGSNTDQANGVALSSGGAIALTGTTFSSNFPTTSGALQGSLNSGGGARDAFVTRISPSVALTTRVISSSYDGVGRLSGAAESPGASYAYSYDLAGNRTSVTLNGGAPTTYSYNAANQISNAGYTYDTAGNLTAEGSTTYSYDGLGSVRQTVSNSAAPLGVVNYDRWGTPESGTVPTFGFTGKLHTSAAGQFSPALFALPALFCYTLHSNRRVEVKRTA